MSQLLRARWVVPVTTPPIRDGWVLIRDGLIAAVGNTSDNTWHTLAPNVHERDLGNAAVFPGLVNAHTHLELSWMRGRLPAAATLPEWIRSLMELRRERVQDDAAAISAAIGALRATGTVAVGEITNTLASVQPLREGRLDAVVFSELIGFVGPRAASIVDRAIEQLDGQMWSDRVRPALAAHAPYSVSPALFRAIAAVRAPHLAAPRSVHLAESREEVEFLQHGTGPWRRLLNDVGAWDPEWRPPGTCPLAYLDDLGFLNQRLVVVHGVWLTDAELGRLAMVGATLVTCARSTLRTGAGVPPIARFYESGVRVAVGTDSLAGVDDLNLFGELRELRRLAPGVPAARLLRSATLDGAAALGRADLGAIQPGCRARLVAIEVPRRESDVEEYLVNGINAEQVESLEVS